MPSDHCHLILTAWATKWKMAQPDAVPHTKYIVTGECMSMCNKKLQRFTSICPSIAAFSGMAAAGMGSSPTYAANPFAATKE